MQSVCGAVSHWLCRHKTSVVDSQTLAESIYASTDCDALVQLCVLEILYRQNTDNINYIRFQLFPGLITSLRKRNLNAISCQPKNLLQHPSIQLRLSDRSYELESKATTRWKYWLVVNHRKHDHVERFKVPSKHRQSSIFLHHRTTVTGQMWDAVTSLDCTADVVVIVEVCQRECLQTTHHTLWLAAWLSD